MCVAVCLSDGDASESARPSLSVRLVRLSSWRSPPGPLVQSGDAGAAGIDGSSVQREESRDATKVRVDWERANAGRERERGGDCGRERRIYVESGRERAGERDGVENWGKAGSTRQAQGASGKQLAASSSISRRLKGNSHDQNNNTRSSLLLPKAELLPLQFGLADIEQAFSCVRGKAQPDQLAIRAGYEWE